MSLNQTILVTGGAGYIGSQTCKLLARSGYKLIIIDNLSRGHRKFVKWGELCVVDLANYQDLIVLFEKHRPAAVVHFAAFAYVDEAMKDPALYYWNNVRNSLHLFEAMRKTGCTQVVFSSSCATYGIPLENPIQETSLQNPVNPYGQTKLMIERILHDYSHAYNLRSVSLRYFNASGADPEQELGELHFPETHLIPLALEAAANPSRPLTLHGNDYSTPDGTCIRDYIHVFDLASAHFKALQYLERGGKTTALNIGTGKGHSVSEVIQTVQEVTGKTVPLHIGPRREGDPAILFADPKLAIQTLNWQPKFPELSTQIKHAWNWMLKNATLD